MFTASIPPDAGLLFVTGSESKVNSTIHMFFMRYPIAVVWMDKHGRVVDKQLAKPWRPAYAPKSPAQYYVEAHPDLLNRVQVGDQLTFDEIASS